MELVPELIQAGVGCFKIEGAQGLSRSRPGRGSACAPGSATWHH